MYSTSRHSLGLYRCVGHTCRYVLATSQSGASEPLDLHAVVEQAVAQLVLDRPFLRVGIQGEDTKAPWFVQLPSVDLADAIQWVALGSADHDDLLLRAIERRHDKLWPDVGTRPAWKVLVFPVEPAVEEEGGTKLHVMLDIMFAVHHALADGRTAQLFHAWLLAALNNPVPLPLACIGSKSDGTGRVLTLPPGSPALLTPPQEALVRFTLSPFFFVRTVATELLGPLLARLIRTVGYIYPNAKMSSSSSGPSLWTGPPCKATPYHTRIRVVTVSAPAAKKLLQACRAHGVTLTPLLHALVGTSLSARLQDGSTTTGRRGCTFVASTAIDIRPWITIDPFPGTAAADAKTEADEGLRPPPTWAERRTTLPGVFVTAHRDTTTFAVDTTVSQPAQPAIHSDDIDAAIWHLASAASTSLRSRLATLPADDAVALMSFVGDWHARWRGILEQSSSANPPVPTRPASWEVSNVGVLPTVLSVTSMSASSEETVDAASRHAWRITQSLFTSSAMAAGPPLGVTVSGLRDGVITIALCWQDGVLETKVVERLAEDLERWTTTLEREGSFA